MSTMKVAWTISFLLSALLHLVTSESYRNVMSRRRRRAQQIADPAAGKDKALKAKTLTLKGLKSVLQTEVEAEFTSSTNCSDSYDMAEELFQEAGEHQFQQALQAENNTLSYIESTGDDVSLPTYPFIICNEAQNISGYQRYAELNVFSATHIEQLSNSDEQTCWILQSTATNASAIAEQNDDLSLYPLGSFVKLRQGTIDAIESNGATQFLVDLCPGALLPPGPPGPPGPGPPNDPLHNGDNLKAVWNDILHSLQTNIDSQDATNQTGGIRRLIHSRSLVTENFFWTHLLERAPHLQGHRNLREQLPRAALWARALQQGIDSSNHCSDMFDVLHMTPLENGHSFRVQVGGTFDAGSGSNRDHEDACQSSTECVLSLIAGVSSHPAVCSVVNAPDVKLSNHQASWIVQSGQENIRPWFDAGLTGQNQIVAVADTGIDSNHCYFSDGMPFNNSGYVDFSRRKVVQYKGRDNRDSLGGHGSHVAATIAGAKAEGYGMAEGIARDAKLVFFDISYDENMTNPTCCFLPADWTSILKNSYYTGKAKVQNLSWGADYNQYHTYDKWMDTFVYDNPDFLIVVAAGNNGMVNGVGSPAVSKNVITVGSTFSDGTDITYDGPNRDYLASFSARGPTADGRIKPDVVAPGEWILSANARPDLARSGKETCDPNFLPALGGQQGGLLYHRGTSVSTPVVSGTIALVRQYFEEGWHVNGSKNEDYGFSPSAALVKAVLITGAQPLLGIDSEEGNIADYDCNQGFGRVTLHTAMPLENNTIALFVDDDHVITNGEVHNTTVQITLTEACNVNSFSVTLVWTDPPATPGCTSCVLNHLDLSLIRASDGLILYPNGLDSKDTLNNVERVRTLAADQDVYIIRVEGTNLSTESQKYALAASGCFEVLPDGESYVQPQYDAQNDTVAETVLSVPPTAAPVNSTITSNNETQGSVAQDGFQELTAPQGVFGTGNTSLSPTLVPVNEASSYEGQTSAPTTSPSKETVAPTPSPSEQTLEPTTSPSKETVAPTPSPSEQTAAPTASPSKVTVAPTPSPSEQTAAPTVSPSKETAAPTLSPTAGPTDYTPPTRSPTKLPTANPTEKPASQLFSQAQPQPSPHPAMYAPASSNVNATGEDVQAVTSNDNYPQLSYLTSRSNPVTVTYSPISSPPLASPNDYPVAAPVVASGSLLVKVVNTVTGEVLCEQMVSAGASEYKCAGLPYGVLLQVVFADATDGSIVTTRNITLSKTDRRMISGRADATGFALETEEVGPGR